jgi:uncharacterized protein with HEPN domain
MSKRRPSFFIKDILTCISRIESYTSDLTFEDFSKNFMAVEACLYNIQVIGEAVSNLPESLRENESQIPWNLMKGMRNRLIHEYFGTDLSICFLKF